MIPNGVLTSAASSTYPLGEELLRSSGWAGEKATPAVWPSAAALHGERRVSARRGGEGENIDRFDYPAHYHGNPSSFLNADSHGSRAAVLAYVCYYNMRFLLGTSFLIPLLIGLLISNDFAQAQLERLRKNGPVEQAAPVETPMVEIPAGEFAMGLESTIKS